MWWVEFFIFCCVFILFFLVLVIMVLFIIFEIVFFKFVIVRKVVNIVVDEEVLECIIMVV